MKTYLLLIWVILGCIGCSSVKEKKVIPLEDYPYYYKIGTSTNVTYTDWTAHYPQIEHKE